MSNNASAGASSAVSRVVECQVEAEAVPLITPKEVSVEGQWTITIKSPTGPMATTLVLERKDGELTGTQSGEGTTSSIGNAKFEQGEIFWTNQITKPMKLKLEFSGVIDGNSMTGKVKTGFMGAFPFTGVKASS